MKTNIQADIDIAARNIPRGMSRRSFLKRFSGGVVIAVSIFDFEMLEAAVAPPYPDDFNAYLQIKPDGSILCFTGKIEMGQGVNTSLAMMMAEELDVHPDRVEMIMGDTDLCPYDRGTWGSQTTRMFGPALRAAASRARAVFLQLASEKWSRPVSSLSVNDGVISLKDEPERKISYAELSQGKRIIKSFSGKPTLKKPSEFKVIGKPRHRADAKFKVTGEAKYAGDIRLPGMVYAKILRPPSHDAKLVRLDDSAVKNSSDVQLVRDGDLIAVLHEDTEVAANYLSKIKAEYQVPESGLNEETIFDYLEEKAPKGKTIDAAGDLSTGEADSEVLEEERFLDGYVAHAPMEPHTALANMSDGQMTVWASTQNPFGLKADIAKTLGLSSEKVLVKQVFVGGGFGGKSSNGQALEAARLAKLSGKPVMVAWTRREEFFYDSFRPAAVVKIKAGCRKNGQMTMWDYGVYFAGQRGAKQFYNIPHHQTQAFNAGWRAPKVHPFATGAWRAPGNNTNTFARETMINRLAHKVGMDPVEFRLKNLKDQRMIRVLKVAIDKFGWQKTISPSGKGWGIACGIDAGAYVALMAQTDVDKDTGKVKVNSVVVAQDMGLVINPQGATIQAEGCVTMGLGYALSEDIQFTGGKIHNRNFNSYEIPKISWTPKIEVELLDVPDEPAQGGGEPAIIAMGALLANAIYDAVGAEMHQLPMTPERIKAALS